MNDFKRVIKMRREKKSISMIVYKFLKRFIDIVLSLIALVFAFLIILFFSIAIMIESEGSWLFSQKRIGKNMRDFNIYKLRSMYKDSEKDGASLTNIVDSRITKVGKVMRKTRIDELPQIINILKNDMSIVGPRPEQLEFVQQYIKEIPRYGERFKVKGGLTGLAQIQGGYDLTPQEKLEKDLYYIEHRSLCLDLYIILKTVMVVVTGKGAR